MIQDIYPHKLFNQYQPLEKPSDDDNVIMFNGNSILLKEERLPKVKEVTNRELIYLFAVDEEKYFLNQEKEEGFKEITLNEITSMESMDKHVVYAIYTGKHLSDWYGNNRYCGRCGKPMHHSDKERALKCDCGYTCYPKIMPAVIVGVTDGDEIVLTKYSTGFRYNALVAGFVEIGETIEECVAREVYEEIGLKVKNIRYYGSQPWGTANDILVGFYCEVDGDKTIHRDQNELKYAEWTKREDIELQPVAYSLTNEMMQAFKEGRDK